MCYNKTMSKQISFNAGQLKLFALVSMTVDHIAAVMEPVIPALSTPLIRFPQSAAYPGDLTPYLLMRGFGRLAFPIFAFFIAEGYLRTKDLKRYALRLLILALVSEIPFNYALKGAAFYPGYQNTIWTLLAGLLTIAGSEAIRSKLNQTDPDSRTGRHAFLKGLIPHLILVPACLIVHFAHTDYSAFGVLLIYLLYVLRDDDNRFMWAALLTLWEGPAIFSYLLLSRYNGEKGLPLKWIFYLYYPLHLTVIVLIYLALVR